MTTSVATTISATTMPKETRATQLRDLLAFAEANGYTGGVDKLTKVLEQFEKKPATGVSKTATANAILAKDAYSIMPIGEPITNKWITEHVRGIMTPNKSAVIMAILIKEGLVSRQKVGKVMTYTRLETDED